MKTPLFVSLLAVLLLLFVACVSAAWDVPSNENLKICLPFDNASVIENTANRSADGTTITGSNTLSLLPKLGGGYNFSGSNALSIPSGIMLLEGRSFTFNLWLLKNPEDINGNAYFLIKGNTPGVAGNWFKFFYTGQGDNSPGVSTYGDDLSGNMPYIANDKWTMLTFTFNATSKNQSLYVNGTLIASRIASVTLNSNADNTDVLIGANDGSNLWRGQISTLSAWEDRALSANDVFELYDNEAGVDCAALVNQTPACVPSWNCSVFGSCNSSNVTPCLNVSDANVCGVVFNGTLSDYDGSCVFVPPVTPPVSTQSALFGVFVSVFVLLVMVTIFLNIIGSALRPDFASVIFKVLLVAGIVTIIGMLFTH